jgi:hypothetical protein
MHQIYPNAGLVEWLHRMIGDGVNYHLYDNDFTPDQGTILTDLNEASFSGYAPAGKVSSDFQDIGIVNNNGLIMATPAAFSNTSGLDAQVYGYFVTNGANDILLAVGRFDITPTIVFANDNFYLTTLFADFSKYLT